MRIEIEFAGDIDVNEMKRFMEALTYFIQHWKYLLGEIRIVREPKQTE